MNSHHNVFFKFMLKETVVKKIHMDQQTANNTELETGIY